jgi:hypothetical protein
MHYVGTDLEDSIVQIPYTKEELDGKKVELCVASPNGNIQIAGRFRVQNSQDGLLISVRIGEPISIVGGLEKIVDYPLDQQEAETIKPCGSYSCVVPLKSFKY